MGTAAPSLLMVVEESRADTRDNAVDTTTVITVGTVSGPTLPFLHVATTILRRSNTGTLFSS